jgi:hypothetical protein
MITDAEFEFWKAERNKAIGGTLNEFTAYAIKHGQIPSDPEIYEISYHKCRTALMSLPIEIRQASKDWLNQRGYTDMM